MKMTLRVLGAFMVLLMFTACPNGTTTDDENETGSGDETETVADTDTIVDIAAISGLTIPVLGETPVSSIADTAEYTGTVTWDGGWDWSSYFGGEKAYTATITLTAKSGYTFTGVVADFFTVAGASTVSNAAGSGVITAVFPATATLALGDSSCGGYVAYILQSGDTGYVAGEQRGLIASSADMSSGIIWATASYQTTSVTETLTAFGTGSVNTDLIIAQNGAGTTYAAGLARSCTDGGYSDWFLPSWEEVYQLYLNKAFIGSFAGELYWSSSEVSATSVATLNSGNGNQHNQAKSENTWDVRPVRYF